MTFATEVLVKASILLAVSGLLAAIARRASASTRHALWVATFASLLALPALVVVGPRWGVLASERPSAASATAAPSRDASVFAPVDVAPNAQSVGIGHASSTVDDPRVSPTLPSVLLALWALVALLCALRVVIGGTSLARVRRRARPLPASWETLLSEERAIAGIRRDVTLVLVPNVTTPMTWGIAAPVIAFPEDAERWDATRRRMALRHELAHIARRDTLTQLVASVACAVYWFHPGVWLAARRLVVERERACDDRVLAAGSAPEAYAAELIAIARQARRAGLPSLVTVAMARPSELEGRVLAILDHGRRRTRPTAGRVTLGIAVAALALLNVAAVDAAPVAAARPCARVTTLASRSLGDLQLRYSASPWDACATAPLTLAQRDASQPARGSEPDSVIQHRIATTPGGLLDIDLPTGGALDIRGWDENAVSVRVAFGGRDWRDSRVSVERAGSGVRLTSVADPERREQGFSHRFQINVPRHYDVAIHSAGGTVMMRDLAGQFTGSTGGGRIDLSNMTGRVRLTTGGGDVLVHDVELDGHVGTGSGTVSIQGNRGHLDADGDRANWQALDEQPEKFAKLGKREKPAKREKDDKLEKLEKNEKAEKGEKGEKGEKFKAKSDKERKFKSDEPRKRDGKIERVSMTTNMRDEPSVEWPRASFDGAEWTHKNGGSIDLEAAPRGARLFTAGGNVHVGRAAVHVGATTGGGDIALGPVDGSVDAHTGAGNVSVILDGADIPGHDVAITTGYGKVDLYVPAASSIRFELETAYTGNLGRQTKIGGDWPITTSETSSWSDAEGTPRRYVRGNVTLGSGRNVVRVRAVNGDVRIHRR